MHVTGGCYCGAIRYESKGELAARVQCHCRECQYVTGGSPNVFMVVPDADFGFTQGMPKSFRAAILTRQLHASFALTAARTFLRARRNAPAPSF